LPSVLWQILRPFITTKQEYDQAFAETFALPEFTLSRGGAEKAASRVLSILASYKDIPETTAIKMLTNDLLLAELQTKRTEQELKETIDSELAKENAFLIEDKAAMENQLEKERSEQLVKAKKIEDSKNLIDAQKTELEARELALRQKESEMQRLQQDSDQKLLALRLEVDQATKEVKRKDSEFGTLENRVKQASYRSGIAFAIASVLLFELLVQKVIVWTWLLNNTNSYGLQASFCLLIVCAVFGALVESSRKIAWWGIGAGVLLVIFQLLGGPVIK
jgi:hypothetical protein